MKPNLSKSQFIKGLQCHKALWLYKNKREFQTPPDEATDLPPNNWSMFYVKIMDLTKGVSYEQEAFHSRGYYQ